jgi:talin
MAAINLKITTGPGVIKSFRFSVDQPIGELARDIREKIGDEGSGKDHALFQAGTKARPPRWLKNNRTLKFYNINNGVRVFPSSNTCPWSFSHFFFPFYLVCVGERGIRWRSFFLLLRALPLLRKQADLEYKKKHRVIKIQLMDETVKSIMIDSSEPVSEIIKTIGSKLDLKNSEEYSVRKVNSGDSALNSPPIYRVFPWFVQPTIFSEAKRPFAAT